MRSVKGLWPLLIIFVAGLLWLIFFSEPVAHFVSSWFENKKPPGISLGRIVQVSGRIKRINLNAVQTLQEPLTSAVDLVDGDRLEVDKDSRAFLILNSQDEFELGPLSSVQLQLWNGRDANSAIYLTWLGGALELRKAGIKNKAYVVRDGRLYLPGQRPTKKALALTVLRPASSDLQLPENLKKVSDEFEDEIMLEDRETEEPLQLHLEPESLSNEYIDETIAARQAQFQKCWLSRLKDNPNLKGQIVLQFEITQRGKVRDVRIAEATLDDETLKNCVTQVVQRLSFRSFKGPEISLSYPISFE